MYKCPKCKKFASLSKGKCWKCGSLLVDTLHRKNGYVRSTLPYGNQSEIVNDAKRLLMNLDKIRMKQDSCPGSGHFASGRAALEGVIRLGFKGQIEVIHSCDDDSIRNMTLCYHHFTEGSYRTIGPHGNPVEITYCGLTNVHNMNLYQGMQTTQRIISQRGTCILGIYGASDGYGNEEDGLPNTFVSGPAESLNTRCAIVLQPFAWPRVRMIEDRSGQKTIDDPHANHYRCQILRGSLAGHILEVPNLCLNIPSYQRSDRSIKKIVENYALDNKDQTSEALVRTYVSIITKTIGGGCHLLPVYGLHTNTGRYAINTIVKAIHSLKVEGFIDGPVIIYNIRGRYEADEEAISLCASKELSASNEATPNIVANAVEGIYVIRSEGLASLLFNQIAANATLPMILEGANTANLCLQIGTPFLALSDNDSIPHLEGKGTEGRAELRSLTQILWGETIQRPEDIQKVANSIKHGLTPDTILYTYYTRLHEIVRRAESDQLVYALATLYRQIDRQGPPLPQVNQRQLKLVFPSQGPRQQSQMYKCLSLSCTGFASLSPGKCWKCGKQLQPSSN